tara:strand:- start:9378 stop:11156 length:1779 start_codon:yes stop_codon:yes gene_type:complete
MKAAPKRSTMGENTAASMLNNLFVEMAEVHELMEMPYFDQILGDFKVGDFKPAHAFESSANAAAAFYQLCHPHSSSSELDPNEQKFAEGVAEIGRLYMKEVSNEPIGRYHPTGNLSDSRRAIRAVSSDEEPIARVEDLAKAQTALYSLYESARKGHRWWGDKLGNVMAKTMRQLVPANDVFNFFQSMASNQAGADRTPNGYLSGYFAQHPVRPYKHEKCGVINRHEIRPWSVVPLVTGEGRPYDLMTTYFATDAVKEKLSNDLYTPYFTTIDYYVNDDDNIPLYHDCRTVFGNADIIPLIVSREMVLFIHRKLGFFQMRSLNRIWKEADVEMPLGKGTHNFKEMFRKQLPFERIELIESPIEQLPKTIKRGPHYGERAVQPKIVKWQSDDKGSMNTLEHEIRSGRLPVPISSKNAQDFTLATRLKYGICVGLVVELKQHTVLSKLTVADAVIPTRSMDRVGRKYKTDGLLALWDSTTNSLPSEVKYHAPLRVLYQAKTSAPMWSEMARAGTDGSAVPRPTHKSTFVASWKDARPPITVNLGGAPPLGFNHRESRCTTCNGRVILTMPRGWSQEVCPCPHCAEGEIQIKEVKS